MAQQVPRHTRPRRRHAAFRSRVVAGALSVVLFLGLGTGMAVKAATAKSATTVTVNHTTTSSPSPDASSSGSSGSSPWSGTPDTWSSGQAMTSSSGS